MEEQRGWALVTGASAGLGEQFALALAARGQDVVLVARRIERLEALARRITDSTGRRVEVVGLDLLAPNAAERLVEHCAAAGIEVELLVNNAGFGTQGAFAALDRDRQLDMLRLNASVLTDLTHRFLPALLARRRGAILNVASTAAFMPGAGLGVYYASKAYVLHFTEALAVELEGTGVRASALCPGPTETEFRDVAGRPRSGLLDRVAMQALPVVEAGLAGLERGRVVVVPGLFNKLCVVGVRCLPRSLVRRAIGRIQATD
ncbi:Sulfoacetaldehyde reductase [Planctomycetes bacterium Pla163]|uniref:Sulfoacetaldehyde reductase n=1 Tax=Rohdeia mirabilis TaxID=2528008 RepID=A0A518D252_9BACT|nr:Sulfoacetaldehyde reductase [Planctomycetes bacterium Pla163]